MNRWNCRSIQSCRQRDNQKAKVLVSPLVVNGSYPNRSQAIEAALRETMSRWAHVRLIQECAMLDSAEECTIAEEKFGAGS